ncbi:MAG: Ig-like domain-containing protein [Oscillospiraceae bacterium]|nr:Ig-like domain-containing protein [Oscillospiraceae bacterium]
MKNLIGSVKKITAKLIGGVKKTAKKLIGSVKKKPAVWGLSTAAALAVCVFAFIAVDLLNDGDNTIAPPEIEQPVITTEPSPPVTMPRPHEEPPPSEPTEIVLHYGRDEIPDISSFLTSVSASKTVGRVVATDSEFNITTAHDITIDELKSRLVLEYAAASNFLDFELSRSSEAAKNNFVLKSNSLLPDGEIIRLALLDDDGTVERRWTFQTAPIFRITSTHPRDEATHVPVDSGIEIYFTTDVNIEAMKDYFTMTDTKGDEIDGEFQRYRNTVVFVPTRGLKVDAAYIVTLKEGLPSEDGLILEEGVNFTFETSKDSKGFFFYKTGGITETFLPGDPAVLELRCSTELQKLDYEIKLFQFDNSDIYREKLNEYIDNNKWYKEHEFDVSGLREVYSSTEKLIQADDKSYSYWTPSFLLLPENLSPGFYIAEVKTTRSNTEYKTQKLIQISPISVYSSRLPNESLFFINDTSTGLAAQNAGVGITIDGKRFSAQTNAEGIANVNVASEKSGRGILEIEYGGSLYLDLFDCREQVERTPEENYFLHLYTDRETYKTTDDIYIWGVIIPREKGISLPTDLYLQAGEETENVRTPITLRPDGTFTSHIKLTDYMEAWSYSITLMSGDERMARKNISIKDYENPLYVFDTNVPFYAWMPHKEPITLSLTASFYEGTPAKDINFEVAEDKLVTDENGFAETTVLRNNSTNTWRPQVYNPVYVLTGTENMYQRKTERIYELYRDVMLESDYSADEGRGTLNIVTSMVDPTNFLPIEPKDTSSYYGLNYNSYRDYRYDDWYGGYYYSDYYYSDYYYYDYHYGYINYDFNEILRGEAVDVKVTGELTRHWSEKISEGSYYNFIEKKNVQTYRYESRSAKVGTYEINTSDGKGAFENLPVGIEGSSYKMILTWTDTYGQPVEQTIWLYQRSEYYYYDRDTSLHNYGLSTDSRNFTEDETKTFKLIDNGDDVTNIPPNAKIFMAVSGSEFITVTSFDSDTFTHTMTDSYVPNVYISGAYFDGRHIFPLAVNQYTFDSSDREITVGITADKDKYRPSENAIITVTAKDINGRNVTGARVHLSVVDEAAFAINDQRINTLRMLYAYIGVPTVRSYHSYVQHSLFGQSPGEMGGGGDSDTPVRRDFKDNAAFLSGTTDSSGRAVFNVALPDNLTAWRLTAQVIGDDINGTLCAGNTKEPLIVTIPFFLTVNSLPAFIVGDDISVSVRLNGIAFNNSEDSEKPLITGRLTGEDVDITTTSYSNGSLNFGKLPEGSYTLLVRASDGTNSDAIELPLEIVSSLLETPISRSFSLNDGLEALNPLRYPVSLRFYDNRNCFYTDMTDYLFSNWSSRTDSRVARAYAMLQLENIDEDYYSLLLKDVTSSGSLVRLLPHGDGDLTLTALLCVSAPDVINKGAVTASFNNIITEKGSVRRTAEEITTAYLGLAALGEPVLLDIIGLLDEPNGLKDDDKLRLCAALALLGDEYNALRHYLEITENNFAHVRIISSDEMTIKVSDDRHTALALLTAGTLNLPEAEGMAKYLMAQKLTDQTFVLEIMNYIKHYNGVVAEPAEFSYTLFGETQTVSLNRGWGRTIKFGKEQLENVTFEVLTGDVGVRAFYTGTVSEMQEEPTLSVEKTYRLLEGTEWVPGALVRVTITIKDPPRYRSYSIEDVIPSGARYVGRDGANTGWLWNRSLQRVSGNICFCSYCYSRNRYFTYEIRLTASGEFITESAVARNSNELWGMSERGVMIIE